MVRLAAAHCLAASGCPAGPFGGVMGAEAGAAPTWRSSWSAWKHCLRSEASQARSRRRTLALSAMVDSSLRQTGGRGKAMRCHSR